MVSKEIVINEALELSVNSKEESKYFKDKLTNEYKKGKIVRGLPDADTYHTNFLNYLIRCWSFHCGAVIDPVYLWQMILCELATVVKASPEAYRSHFTDSMEKKEILIPTEDPIEIDVNALCVQLRGLIKEDIDTFLPDFSTHTKDSRFAHSAAFCEAVSPFYNYSMYLCGIPRIRIQGTEADWNLFKSNLGKLKVIFPTKARWLSNIIDLDLMTNDSDFWKRMITMKQCGSGSQFEINGWIIKLFIDIPKFALPENFSTHVSEVDYKNITTKKEYTMFSGLFCSHLESDFLIPSYSVIINENVKETPKITDVGQPIILRKRYE